MDNETKFRILTIVFGILVIIIGMFIVQFTHNQIVKHKDVCEKNGMVIYYGIQEDNYVTCIDENGDKKYLNKEGVI